MVHPNDETATREDRRRRAVWGERPKPVIDLARAVALAVLGVGVLRSVLDPGAAAVDLGRLLLTGLAALAIEVLALYLLGRLKPEDWGMAVFIPRLVVIGLAVAVVAPPAACILRESGRLDRDRGR